MTMSHTLSSLFTLRLLSFIRLKNGSKADLLQWKQMIITCLKLYQNFFRFRCKNLKFEFRTNIPGVQNHQLSLQVLMQRLQSHLTGDYQMLFTWVKINNFVGKFDKSHLVNVFWHFQFITQPRPVSRGK